VAVKLLLDTDIGSDIDDAVCLAYLLAQPQCELLGITTVSGEAERRAQMAGAMCNVAGKTIPILPGAEEPLLVPQRQPTAPQASMLDRWPHSTRFAHGAAVEFLRSTVRSNPGEVTLLAIGPLTNIALLFAVDPEIAGLLRSLVLMCGVFETRWGRPRGHTEWNAVLDPHAAAMVYAASAPIHRSIGLDVTTQVRMGSDEVRRRFRHPLLAPVLDFAQVWFKDRPEICFHDPLAAATIFDDTLCSFDRGAVHVETSSIQAAGFTYWERAADGPHEVALAVDRERFFAHYFSVFA
jgi:inosine-uridine nucleoside N-ribohydrolase